MNKILLKYNTYELKFNYDTIACACYRLCGKLTLIYSILYIQRHVDYSETVTAIMTTPTMEKRCYTLIILPNKPKPNVTEGIKKGIHIVHD